MTNPNWFNRLTSPTPRFFKKVRGIGLTLTTVGTFLTTGIGFDVSSALLEVGKSLFIAGSVMALVAQSAVKDKTN